MKFKILTKMLIACLSGLLTSLAFYHPSLAFLFFISISPFFICIYKATSIKLVIALGFIFSFSYYFSLTYWMYDLIKFFGQTNYTILLSSLVRVLIATLMASIFVGCLAFYNLFKKNDYKNIFVLPALFVLAELLQENLLVFPFTWGKIGLITNTFPIFIQSSSLFGPSFVSLLVLIINSFMAFCFVNSGSLSEVKTATVVVSLIVCLNLLYGMVNINMDYKGNTFEALLLQGNYSNKSKRIVDSNIIIEEYLEIADKNKTNKSKLIIMPETSITTILNNRPDLQGKLSSYCNSNNLSIITGANYLKNDQLYNCLALIDEKGYVTFPYSKQELVPFGEYVPFSNVVTTIIPETKKYNIYSKGKDSGYVNTSTCRIGGLICYESAFSKLTNTRVLEGGDVLVVISNDSWFENTSAIYQHHANSVMRAVETQRYVLNTNNSGITSVISPNGFIQDIIPPDTHSALVADVYPIKNISLFTLIGNYGVFCISIGILYKDKNTHR